LIAALPDHQVAASVRLRAEKRARRDSAAVVAAEHVRPFLETDHAAPVASKCPFAAMGAESDDSEASESAPLAWTAEAERRLERVPEGFMRSLTRQRIEAFTHRHGADTVTPELIDSKYADWAAGSARQGMTLEWTDSARARMGRIPDFVRGMVVLEIERCAGEAGRAIVTDEDVDRATGAWDKSGAFHSQANPDLYE
jgi:hypothetical protein